MNTSEIKVLLEKFYEGSTSLGEEMILRNYFLGKEVPVQLKEHQSLFIYFINEKRQNLGDPDFDQKLTNLISNTTDEVPVVQMNPKRRRFIFMTSMAASVVILVGLFFTFQHDLMKGAFIETSKPDAEIAYADARGALLLVSGNLNHGLEQVEHLQMVDKAMKNIQLFNKFYQYQTIIINPDVISNQSLKSK
ncbi:MAG: hypothetical protein NTW16_11570 [Bacteroidetes bacterium]|nr:hypothetical protein [Bacteroidota bacterium]